MIERAEEEKDTPRNNLKMLSEELDELDRQTQRHRVLLEVAPAALKAVISTDEEMQRARQYRERHGCSYEQAVSALAMKYANAMADEILKRVPYAAHHRALVDLERLSG